MLPAVEARAIERLLSTVLDLDCYLLRQRALDLLVVSANILSVANRQNSG